MARGIHDYIGRQAADLGISKSAFVENAIYQYVHPKQLHLDKLSVPDIDGRVQTEMDLAESAWRDGEAHGRE